MKYLITKWQLKWTKWLRFPVVFEESAILPANVRNLKWKCWLWGVQETKCYDIYTTRHGKASPFQLWWSVRGAIPIFDVNRCSLPGSMFCVCLLRLGLAVTGAQAENFRTRVHAQLQNKSVVCSGSRVACGTVIKSWVYRCNRVYCIRVPGHDPLIFSFLSFSFLIGWEFYGPYYLRC